jgi:hypothetical protein
MDFSSGQFDCFLVERKQSWLFGCVSFHNRNTWRISSSQNFLEDAMKREFDNPKTIDDNFLKHVVLMDAGIYEYVPDKGIICCGLREFLETETFEQSVR